MFSASPTVSHPVRHGGGNAFRATPASQLIALEKRMLFDGSGLVSLLLAHVGEEGGADAVPPPVPGQPRELLVVDGALTETAFFTARLPDHVDILTLAPGEDGLARVTAYLNQQEGQTSYSAIHILSHGAPGAFFLGSTRVDASMLARGEALLSSWSQALTPDADLLIYGCDVAAGEGGGNLLTRLSELTGADVAASLDRTGAVSQGGDWVLENRTGRIDAEDLARTAGWEAYDGVLSTNISPVTFAMSDGQSNVPSPGVTGNTILEAVGYNDANTQATPWLDATSGLAVTQVTGQGNWQYSTNSTDGGNGTWTNFPNFGPDYLLLDHNTWVRFVPGPDWTGVASFTFKGWDESIMAGSAQSLASPGTLSISLSTGSATVEVNIVVNNGTTTSTNQPPPNQPPPEGPLPPPPEGPLPPPPLFQPLGAPPMGGFFTFMGEQGFGSPGMRGPMGGMPSMFQLFSPESQIMGPNPFAMGPGEGAGARLPGFMGLDRTETGLRENGAPEGPLGPGEGLPPLGEGPEGEGPEGEGPEGEGPAEPRGEGEALPREGGPPIVAEGEGGPVHPEGGEQHPPTDQGTPIPPAVRGAFTEQLTALATAQGVNPKQVIQILENVQQLVRCR